MFYPGVGFRDIRCSEGKAMDGILVVGIALRLRCQLDGTYPDSQEIHKKQRKVQKQNFGVENQSKNNKTTREQRKSKNTQKVARHTHCQQVAYYSDKEGLDGGAEIGLFISGQSNLPKPYD